MTPARTPAPHTAVAIIGMAGRFPDAQNVDAFWDNIARRVRSIRSFSDEELRAAGVSPDLLQHPRYIKSGTVVDGIDRFDANFFGYPPREAELIDPQHRLFLECAWQALEDAAYAPETYRGLIGVFAGSAPSTYVTAPPGDGEILASTGPYYLAMHNAPDSLASTVSYKLNLRGPSVAVQTFCSTSLVATHLACQSLLTYECGLALAGGVAIGVPQGVGYVYHEGGILSPDGRCRSFDAHAQGSVMGSGLGLVVLKRLAEAIADRDHIYAVIRGSAVNNDGIRKVGYTAPGMAGQAAVIATALRRAGVDADSVSHIEAHGTGTALGDSVEIDAMKQVFGRSARKGFCALGSVKPNIGHLDRAAGAAGLIKTALALDRRQLPPSIDFDAPNPDAGLETSPFYVNTTLRAWPDGDGPRCAGVNSFGAGGTNAHVVLEEAPAPPPTTASRPYHVLVLSAKTDAALQAATTNLAAHLRQHPDLDLADVSWTLAVGRTVFNHRGALVCRDIADAVAGLESREPSQLMTSTQVRRRPSVVFRFASAIDGEVARGSELEAEAGFRAAAERCRAVDVSGSPQAAQFIAQFATARLLISWGIAPRASTGTGIGAYVARCIAGELSVEDALALARSADPAAAVSIHAAALGCASPAEAVDVSRADDVAITDDDHVVEITGAADLARVIEMVGRLWLEDVAIDWNAFHGPHRRRVRLPSYPFERQRYWMQATRRVVAGDEAIEPARKTEVGEWFYAPSWKRSAPPAEATAPAQRWLILADEWGLGSQLAAWLNARGQSVMIAGAADSTTDALDVVRPSLGADYERLLNEVARRGGLPNRIVHLWMVDRQETDTSIDDVEPTIARGFHSLVALTQALTNAGVEVCEIDVISTGLQDVDAADTPNPAKATALGPVRVIPQECAGFRCRSIDVVWPPDERASATLIERLGRELLGKATADVVALRGAHRWVEAFEPVTLGPSHASARLRPNGVYLITGGLGGIGLGIAEHLAETVNARLALVGRSAPPGRDEWPQLLTTYGPSHPIGRRIRVLRALEERGVDMLVLRADVSAGSEMRAAVERTRQHFGAVHGVIHAAGVPGAGLIALKSTDAASRVLAPKVHGALALARALEGMPLDFLALFSSVTSVVGGPGQVDYSAANSFLDAFARRHRADHGMTLSISWCEWQWDAWQEGLLGFPSTVRDALVAHRRQYGISFEEGAEVFRRALAGHLPHVYVATFDLNHLISNNRQSIVTRLFEEAPEGATPRAGRTRPALGSSLVLPRDDAEERIASIWRDVLGIAPIGIDDNFFELGGNSLLGIEVAARVRKALHVDVAVQRLYEAPTVCALADYVRGTERGAADVVAEDWQARAEKRRARFRHTRIRS